MINPGSQPMYQRTIEQQCARSHVASMLASPLQCWSPMTMMTIMVNEDHDYDDGHGLQV